MKNTHFGNKVVAEEEKEGLVRELFTSVAGRYDLMNDLMSLGTHRLWKRLIVGKTGLRAGETAIDVAGGTADIAMLMKDRVGEGGQVVVYDINREMLALGREKCIDKGLIKNMRYVQGDAESISFEDNTFHCATVGFGIRNVTRLEAAFKEMARVVKPGGRVVCLEFSHLSNPALQKLYDAYSFNVIPMIGEAITGRRSAYDYLVESIRKFPVQEELKEIMEGAGLFRVTYHNFFNGIAAVHVGTKV
ncbi:MAG: bifunctional demethylmenaquinone methyltransferase/2-methoxy-6-polyprenyl-1,4-benzoquinol methylase UbiE [Thermodesulfobacteriota bacterium]